MGLYLCVFDDDEELEGVEVGSYSDFEFFRSTVSELLEEGEAASKFPTLINHSDSNGEWSPSECVSLKSELAAIAEGFRQLPAVRFRAEWQQQLADSLGLKPLSLYEGDGDGRRSNVADRAGPTVVRLRDGNGQRWLFGNSVHGHFHLRPGRFGPAHVRNACLGRSIFGGGDEPDVRSARQPHAAVQTDRQHVGHAVHAVMCLRLP